MKNYSLFSAKRGFTLVEAMVAAVILLIVGLALLQVLILSLNYSQQAREYTVIADDLRDVFEEIRSVSFANLPVLYPHNSSIPAAVVGGFQLENEAITISYPAGTGADPLEIQVTVTWKSKRGTTRSYTMKTLRTRML